MQRRASSQCAAPQCPVPRLPHDLPPTGAYPSTGLPVWSAACVAVGVGWMRWGRCLHSPVFAQAGVVVDRVLSYVASVCHIWPYDCVVSLASGVWLIEFLPFMFLIEAHRITHCKVTYTCVVVFKACTLSDITDAKRMKEIHDTCNNASLYTYRATMQYAQANCTTAGLPTCTQLSTSSASGEYTMHLHHLKSPLSPPNCLV